MRGFFLATADEIQKSLGEEVYLGECLGKNSEVQGTLTADAFVLLTDDQDFIRKAEEYKLIPMGKNPLQFIRKYCDECGGYNSDDETCDCDVEDDETL